MRTRTLGPLGVVLALAFPGAAQAVDRCVGTITTPTCGSIPYSDSQAAVDDASNGDRILFPAGTFGPVDTNKVLTFQGVGAGTTTSSAGATVIQNSATSQAGMRLTRGGTVRSLRAVGGPGAGMNSAGTGLNFPPTEDGDMSLTLIDVIGVGGTAPGSSGGTGLAMGDSLTATGTKAATVIGGAFLAGPEPDGHGLAVYTCCIPSTLTNTHIIARGGPGIYASIDSTPTVEDSLVEGQDAIQTQAPALLTVRRSRITGTNRGITTLADSVDSTRISVRDSLVTTTAAGGELAPLSIEADSGQPITFEAVGSTIIGRGDSQAAVRAWRQTAGSAPITATLRNSVARNEAAGGADLLADRAAIGADFSSFNSTSTPNGGSAPTPGSASNVAGDPQLAGDFSLLASSPLIDRGDPGAVLAGELDLAGAARSLDGNGDCAARPDIGAFERPSTCPVVAVANAAPSLENVSATNRVFAPTGRNGRITQRTRRVKRGTRFRYRLSEPARVEIRIERALAGRRSGRRCVRPTRRNRRARRCTRYRRVTTLRANERAGRQSTGFTGRVRRRPLRRGRYRARLVAIDSLGARSRERRLALRIVKP